MDDTISAIKNAMEGTSDGQVRNEGELKLC